MTSEFRCTFCREVVEEDQSALPKKDSRLLLAKFNEQLEPLYILLREVEGIRLSPEILEPEPVDINTIRGYVITFINCFEMLYVNWNGFRIDGKKLGLQRPMGESWSGEATRSQGFAVEETRVDVTIGDDVGNDPNATTRKERPIWMMESTVASNDKSQVFFFKYLFF